MTNASNVTSETETHGRDATYQLERIYGGAPPLRSTSTEYTNDCHYPRTYQHYPLPSSPLPVSANDC